MNQTFLTCLTELEAECGKLRERITMIEQVLPGLRTLATALPPATTVMPDGMPRVKRKYTRRVKLTEFQPTPPAPETVKIMEAVTADGGGQGHPTNALFERPAKSNASVLPPDPDAPQSLAAALKRYIRTKGTNQFTIAAIKLEMEMRHDHLIKLVADGSASIERTINYWASKGKLEKVGAGQWAGYRMVKSQENFFVEIDV